MSVPLVSLALLALQLTAVIFIFRSIRTARTPQGAAAWSIFLFFVPFVAVPIYLFLGNWRYRGYIVARRKAESIANAIAEQKISFGAKDGLPQDVVQCFEKIADLPVVRGNGFALLPDWEAAFGSMFEAIESAQNYVLVQFYIIKDDALGRELQAAMIAAARRGVQVYLLYDAVGSKSLPASYLSALTDIGVQAHDINRLFGPRSNFQINFRNHRKTVVIDGKTGFTGGFNVGDEYAGRDPAFGNWRDTHCKLHGPIVTQLQLIFAEDWYSATHENLASRLIWNAEKHAQNVNGLIMATGPADEIDSGALYFCAAIQAAKRRIWIASPYLVPENDILAAMKLAVLRGVEVRLLLPKHRDHWSTWLAAFAYFDELRNAGVEIWLYDQGFMHQKVVLVDDLIASIGTINLDNRSCRLNFEATAIVFDKEVAKQTEAMFERDFASSEILTQSLADQPLHVRLGAPFARLFSPLL